MELVRKFECMEKAMEELEKIDSRLYMEANKEEDPRARSQGEVELAKTLKGSEKKTLEARIRGLFPRELRIPTDTPSRTGWNYEWKPFNRPF
jgi:large subunit ribosomal protein L40